MGGMDGSGRNGRLASQMGAILPPRCRCNGSGLTVMAQSMAGGQLCCPRSPAYIPSPHTNPFPPVIQGTLIWRHLAPASLSSPLPRTHVCNHHGICVLPQAPPRPPSLPLETRALKGQVEWGCCPALYPQPSWWALSTLK